MVKSATLSNVIPDITVKDYWETLYASGAAVTDFHNTYHGQQEVGVTDWVDNKRVVNMIVPLSLPAFLRSITGKDRVPVRETQEFRWSEDERTLEIFSLPLSQIPGGAKFNTKLEYHITEQEDGVKVTAKVFSHASGPFGLGGAIEGVMLELGSTQTQHWLEFSRERCISTPASWWQQAGKLSRTITRKVRGAGSPEKPELIETTLEKIQSDLDILESLEPKVNLGSVAKDILGDAQLKEQYAQTMMKTLFMLESAEDSGQLNLQPAQAAELREMLLQLQRTLRSITGRKDELLDACLEYEMDSSERVRALAQELQRERVRSQHHHLPDSALDLHRRCLEEQLSSSGRGFPGWDFLVTEPPAASLSARKTRRAPGTQAERPLVSLKALEGPASSPFLEAMDNLRELFVPRPPKTTDPMAPCAGPQQSSPAVHVSSSASSLCPVACGSDPKAFCWWPGSLWADWQAMGAAIASACRPSSGSRGCGQKGLRGCKAQDGACCHQLLVHLLSDLADSLSVDNCPAAGHAKAESKSQAIIELKAQLAEMKRQAAGGAGQSAAVQSDARGLGATIVRRVFLAGVVVLVGRWGLRKRRAKQQLAG